MKNKRFIIASAPLSKETRHGIISEKISSKLTLCINTNCEPWKFSITAGMVERWKARQQAKRDLKTYRNKDIFEPLFYESLKQSMANPTNGRDVNWVAMDMYWSGYARGIREHRQKVKEANINHSAIELMGTDDVIELSQALGINESQVMRACLEISAKHQLVRGGEL